MDKIVDFTLDEIETIDRAWTDQFAKKAGWNEFNLEDPADDLGLFFSQLAGTSILDAGCGWGRYVWRFKDEGLDYIGLDQSIEMLNVARINNPDLIFIESSFRKIPYPSEYFDGVWSCCALSGIPKNNLLEVLLEHKRVMKRSGIIMIVMPDLHESDERMYNDNAGKPSIYQAYYLRLEFLEYVREADFEILSHGSCRDSGSFSVLARKKL